MAPRISYLGVCFTPESGHSGPYLSIFGLGGLIQLVPFLGYELTFVHAKSHVIGVFPEGDLETNTFLLPENNFLVHRGLIGFELVAGVTEIGFEAALGSLQTYTFHAGFNL